MFTEKLMIKPTVVITGASAGIGRASAIEFARHGWNVGLIARGRDGLEGARANVVRAGGEALVLPADTSEFEDVKAAADRAVAEWGAIDVWVNCAMVTVFSRVHEMRPEEYRRVTEVTYLGYVHGTLAALEHMRKRDEGTIVQIGSALAFHGIPLQSAYCGAKFAIRGFTESLRTELMEERSRVRVTMVHMPSVNTPQFLWARSRLARRPQPVPPIFQPEAVAPAIFKAALKAPRQLLVGRSTVETVFGDALAPGLLDRIMAKAAGKGQKSKVPASPNRPDNLFQAVDGDFSTHGPYDKRASRRVTAVNPAHVRWAAGGALAALAVLGLAGAGAASRDRDEERYAAPDR